MRVCKAAKEAAHVVVAHGEEVVILLRDCEAAGNGVLAMFQRELMYVRRAPGHTYLRTSELILCAQPGVSGGVAGHTDSAALTSLACPSLQTHR